MGRPVLVFNAGSSSVKFALYEHGSDGSLAAGPHGEIERIDTAPHLVVWRIDGSTAEDRPLPQIGHQAALAAVIDWFHGNLGGRMIEAVGHRVVHGGRDFAGPVLVDAGVLERLEALVPLAPLHQPHNLAPIRALSQRHPTLPQVACFDTAFHRTQEPLAQEFALPRRFFDGGVCRYGFHGLSYAYVASILPSVIGDEAARGRVIVAHLGNGASLCAMRDLRSVATTMGFTALDGLMMGTRSGALDPGVVLYLMQHHAMSAAEVEDLLYRRSGLLGVSGIASDMRTLLASDTPAAREAVALFVYRIVRDIGSLAAALGGLDALVFTAGIGEHAAPIRAAVIAGSAWLGLHLDEGANAVHGPRISPADPVTAWVVPTNESLMIARQTVATVDAVLR